MKTIYTDGSCQTNPGPGGFGVIVIDNDTDEIICHYKKSEETTTNNEQEMLAILFALARYGKERPAPKVYSDSAYAVNTFTNWMYNWKEKGWKKRDGKDPENLTLIKFYDSLLSNGFWINLEKVKGHSGNYYNELVDKLAKGEISPEEAIKLDKSRENKSS